MTIPSDAVGRVGLVLRAVAASEPGGATTSELGRRTALPRPTSHRLLVALEREGLVERERTSGLWRLGPELYVLGTSAASRHDKSELAQPLVRKLAIETGESAFFSTRRGEETVCILREEGSFPLRSHVLREGIRFPLGVASAGIAILAFLPSAVQDEYLSRIDLVPEYGPLHSRQALVERLRQTRVDGYATNPAMIVEGSWGMAAAIFSTQGEAVAALSLTGVEHRFSDTRRPALGNHLLRAAHTLSIRLQGNGQ